MVTLEQHGSTGFYLVQGTAIGEARFAFLHKRNGRDPNRQTLTLQQTWDEQLGYYVFFKAAPITRNSHPILDFESFVLDEFEGGRDRVFGWFNRANNIGPLIRLSPGSARTVSVGDEFAIKNYKIIISRGTPVTVNARGFEFGSAPNYVTLSNANRREVPFASPTLELPVTGDAADRFLGELALEKTPSGLLQLDVLDIGSRFFFPDSGVGNVAGARSTPNFRVNSYLFCPFELPPTGDPIRLWMSFDYYQPEPNRSFFSFTDPWDASPDPQRIMSTFRSTIGYLIRLESRGDLRLVFADNPTRVPYEDDPLEYYLTPSGIVVIDHVMDPTVANLSEDPPAISAALQLLCGLNGTEYLEFDLGDVLRFTYDRDASSPGNALYDPSKIADANFDPERYDYLSPSIKTSWVSLSRNGGGSPRYYAQTDEAPLYRPDGVNGRPEMMDFQQRPLLDLADNHVFPLVTPAGFRPRKTTTQELLRAVEDYRVIESQGIYAQRRKLLKQTEPRLASRNALIDTVTPQGLKLTLNSVDYVESITFSKSDPQTGGPFDYFEIRDFGGNAGLVDAFERNQLCLFMTRVPQGVDFTSNRIGIRSWFFEIGLTPTNKTTDENTTFPLLLFKYYDRPLVEFDGNGNVTGGLINDPAIWPNGDFLDINKDELRIQLVAIAERIREFALNGTDEDREMFTGVYQKMTSRTWNGILAFRARIVPNAIPQELQALVAGVSIDNFLAQHIGINGSRYETDRDSGRIVIKVEKSSMFALIDYGCPAPVLEPDPTEDFLFEVKCLQVLFENSEIQRFVCEVKLTAFELFRQPTANGSDYVQLTGRYEQRDGVDTYSFLFENPSSDPLFTFNGDGYVVDSVDIERVELVTISSDEASGNVNVDAQFQFDGAINFGLPTGPDVWSFQKLRFQDFIVGMKFSIHPQGDATQPNYYVNGAVMSLDVNSPRRQSSWANLFPIRLKSITFPLGEQRIEFKDLGFIALGGDSTQGNVEFDFGVTFEIDLGSLGGLKSDQDRFTADLMMGWGAAKDSLSNIRLGIKIPESRGGRKEIGINGVIKLLIRDFHFLHRNATTEVPEHFFIALMGSQFEIFGAAFPKDDDDLDIYLFPNIDAPDKGKIGWYAGLDLRDETNQYIEYLGAGQRLGLPDTATSFSSVYDAVRLIPQSEDTNEVSNALYDRALRYNPEQDWTYIAKFHPFKGLTLGVVFHDPKLYSLLVSYAKLFDIEVTYRQITEDIGVYSVEIAFPPSVRNLDFGYFVITIPSIGLDIYTNGNYRVDVGFPVNYDFRRSFKIQAFPFIGAGGFYFSRLNGKTSNLLVGDYALVVQAGFAARLGVGREGSWGILEFGLTLSFYGILEGAIGAKENDDLLHPNSYLVHGEFGVIGELYGVIDFAIIKASVLVRLRLGIGAEIEKRNGQLLPTVLYAESAVDVQVRVVIGRIKVFRASIEVSVTVEFHAVVRAEWVLGGDSNRLLGHTPRSLNWNRVQIATKRSTQVPMYFLPGLTVGYDGATQETRCVALLGLEVSTDGRTPKAFDFVVGAVLDYLLKACGVNRADQLSKYDLLDIARELRAPQQWISFERIRDVILAEFEFVLLLPENAPNAPAPLTAFFPMLPGLVLEHDDGMGGTTQVDFELNNSFDPSYQVCLTSLFEKAFAKPPGPRSGSESNNVSLATYVVEAYFNFIARDLVRRGLDFIRRLEDAPISVTNFVAIVDNRELAGMLTHFFYSGMRAPEGFDDQRAPTGAMRGLYELIGQQFRMEVPSNNDQFAWQLTSKTPLVTLDLTHPPSITTFDPATLDSLLGHSFQPMVTGPHQLSPLKREAQRFTVSKGYTWRKPNGNDTTDEGLWELPQALLEETEKLGSFRAGSQGRRGRTSNRFTAVNSGNWSQDLDNGNFQLVITAATNMYEGIYEINDVSGAELILDRSCGDDPQGTCQYRIARRSEVCLYSTLPPKQGPTAKRGSDNYKLELSSPVSIDPDTADYRLRVVAPTGDLKADCYRIVAINMAGDELTVDAPLADGDSGTCAWEVYENPAISPEHRRWATVVELIVRKVPLSDGVGEAGVENFFELAGMDENNRKLLDQLFRQHPDVFPDFQLHLLYAPRASEPLVLKSDELPNSGECGVHIVRTNLSVESNPFEPPDRVANKRANKYFAELKEGQDFLRLAWRGSIVNSGRYYLHYQSKGGGVNPISNLLRDTATPQVRLQLLIEYTNADDLWHPYYNFVIISQAAHANLPSARRRNSEPRPLLHSRIKTNLAAPCDSEDPDDFVGAFEPSLEPGCVAFQVDRELHEESTHLIAAELDSLYSLLSYKVDDLSSGNIFREIKHTLPITSKTTADLQWVYEQVVPLYNDGASRYLGIGETIRVALGLHDIYGNKFDLPNQGLLTHKYFDSLSPIAEWPEVQSRLEFDTGSGDLKVSLHFRPSGWASGTKGTRGNANDRFRIPDTLYQGLPQRINDPDSENREEYFLVIEKATGNLRNGVYEISEIQPVNAADESPATPEELEKAVPLIVLSTPCANGPDGSCEYRILGKKDLELALEKFIRIRDQLGDSNARAEITTSWSSDITDIHQKLAEFVDNVIDELNGSAGEIEVIASFDVPSNVDVESSIFEFDVAVRIRRNAPVNQFEKVGGSSYGPAMCVRTSLCAVWKNREDLKSFAKDFEHWTSGLLVALGTRAGQPPETNCQAGGARPVFDSKVLWLVQTSAPVVNFSIDHTLFAPRPISTKLLSGDLDLPDPLESGSTTPKRVVAIDVDELARNCFDTIERILTSEALPELVCHSNRVSISGVDTLEALLDTKDLLANTLSQKFIRNLFDVGDPGSVDDAKTRLTESLRVDLRNFYESDVLFQVKATSHIKVDDQENPNGLTFLGEMRTDVLPYGDDGRLGSANNRFAADSVTDWTSKGIPNQKCMLAAHVKVGDTFQSNIYIVEEIWPSELTLDQPFFSGSGDPCRFELKALPEGSNGKVTTSTAGDQLESASFDWSEFGLVGLAFDDEYFLEVFNATGDAQNGVYRIVDISPQYITVQGELIKSDVRNGSGNCSFRITGGRSLRLSPARFHIAPSSGNSAPCTVLVDAKRPAVSEAVSVDLNYELRYVEHQIQQTDGEFRPSSWLSLVWPQRISLQERTIRIPLRGYPRTPQIAGHKFKPANVIPRSPQMSDLKHVPEWHYIVGYSAAMASQDDLDLRVQLNELTARTGRTDSMTDLLTALVNFAEHFPDARETIEQLKTQTGTVRQNLLQKLRYVFKEVGHAFDNLRETRSVNERHTYSVVEESHMGGTKVTIKWDDTPLNHFDADIREGSIDDQSAPIGTGLPGNYSFIDPERYTDAELRNRIVRVKNLNVLHQENAKVGIQLHRNRDLAGMQPNIAFQYMTPWSWHPDLLTPMIIVDEIIPLQTKASVCGNDGRPGPKINEFRTISSIIDWTNFEIPVNTEEPTCSSWLLVCNATGDLINGLYEIVGVTTDKLTLGSNVATGTDGSCTFRVLPPVESYIVDLFRTLFSTTSNRVTGNRRLKVECRLGSDVPLQPSSLGVGGATLKPNRSYYPLSQSTFFEIDPYNVDIKTGAIRTIATELREWCYANRPALTSYINLDLTFLAYLSDSDIPTLRLKRLTIPLSDVYVQLNSAVDAAARCRNLSNCILHNEN